MSPIVLVVIAAVLIIGGVAFFATRRKGGVEERLQTYAGATEQALETTGPKKRASPLADWGNKALEGRKISEDLSTQLARADLKITPVEFLAVQVISALGFGVGGYLVFDRAVILGILAAVVGWFVPRFFVSQRQSRRLKAFNDQIGDALNLMVNGLRSGYSVLQAMEAVSRELPAPVSVEFSRVVQEVQLGIPLDQALSNMLRRLKSDDLDLVITAVNVQREVGGNLAEILDTISFTIRERVRIKGEIRTLTAQGQYSGYVISFLPIALVLVLFCVNKPYVSRLFTSGACGWAMVICGLLMIGTGFFAIQKIVQIEV